MLWPNTRGAKKEYPEKLGSKFVQFPRLGVRQSCAWSSGKNRNPETYPHRDYPMTNWVKPPVKRTNGYLI